MFIFYTLLLIFRQQKKIMTVKIISTLIITHEDAGYMFAQAGIVKYCLHPSRSLSRSGKELDNNGRLNPPPVREIWSHLFLYGSFSLSLSVQYINTTWKYYGIFLSGDDTSQHLVHLGEKIIL